REAMRASAPIMRLPNGKKLAFQRLSKVYLYMHQTLNSKNHSLLDQRPGTPMSWLTAANRTRYYQQADTEAAQGPSKQVPGSSYLPATASNYRQTYHLLVKRGISFIAMQYPTRPIAPLKEIFSDMPGVYFVSNENLKSLAERDGYGIYFTDMYAGDFGHCRSYGNTVIASNISKVLFKEILRLR
ncbi:MAG TPA: hypothetical protein PLL10_10730, partial [Elusimicrobiales bacterium]|nr:hypothetical protein [Elusimicrobiales bacterium]